MDSTGTRVVGSSGWIHGSDTRAFLWSAPTGMRDLGTFQGGDYSEAFGVNDSGTVVGDSNTRENIRAFVWNAQEGMRELSPLPGDVASRAFAINNSGQIVGYSSGKHGVRAVIWSAKLEVRSLGTLPGGNYSEAYAINNAGQVVGMSKSSSGTASLSVDQPRGHGRSWDTAGKRIVQSRAHQQCRSGGGVLHSRGWKPSLSVVGGGRHAECGFAGWQRVCGGTRNQ